MLFFNSRARNAPIGAINEANRPYTKRVGHSCIVAGCLSITTGLILIIIGAISEMKRSTYIGIGIISLGVVFFLTTLVCFYGKLDICYNNWAYRSRVIPINVENAPPSSTGVQCVLPFAVTIDSKEKRGSLVRPTPYTTVSDIEIHRVVPP